MKNSTRKVVILENLTSPYVQQAIIVLNDYNPSNETKVLYDAEKVVNDYLKKNGYSSHDNTKVYTTKKKTKGKSKLLSGLLCLGIMVVSLTIYAIINS